MPGYSCFQGADLVEINFQGADFQGAYLLLADLTGAKFLTTEQLLTVKTLHKVKGLPAEMEKKLRADKPELFMFKPELFEKPK